MQDLLAQVLSYLYGIWRFRWAGLLVAWIIAVIGWITVLKMPDVYVASTKVFVDTQSTLRPLLRGLAVDVNIGSRLTFMTRNLRTRPTLEKVARMTDMDLNVKNPKEMEELIDGLGKRVRIRRVGKQALYQIAFSDNDPQLAKRVVQALLNIFVESTLGATRKDTDVAQQFLKKQIEAYEQRLIAGEERLKNFKRKHVGMMPGQGGGYYKRMEKQRSGLAKARLQMRELEMRRDELQRQIDGEEPTFGFSGLTVKKKKHRLVDADKVSELSPIDQRIQQLLIKQDQLLVKYTERHPDVVALKASIDSLEKQKLEDLGIDPDNPDGEGDDELGLEDESFFSSGIESEGLDTNPVYQNLRIALGKADADLASHEVRVREYEARLKSLTSLVDTVPQVEAELGRLNRNYSVNKTQYNALVSRLESARMSQEADQSSDNVKFKIVQPPRVPLEPSGPNRPFFLVVVFIGSILVGLVLALVLALTRPIFDSRRMVELVTGVAVLGEVTMVWTSSQQWKRRMALVSFLSSFALLGLAFAGVMALEVLEIDLAGRLAGLKGLI